MSSGEEMSEESEYEEEMIEEPDETDIVDSVPKAAADDPAKPAPFQKENWINAHLPYADLLPDEAEAQLRVIKAGIGQSLALKELRPSLLHWACELDKFISLHGRRFTKADHLQLVHTFFRVVLLPGLEFRMVKTFSHVVSILLEKREMLSPSELELPWRGLYDLYVQVTFKNLEEDGTLLLPENISQSLEVCLSRCRPYFPPGATAEILALQRPYLCPWDVSMLRGVSCLHVLLPTTLSPAVHKESGAGLWMDEALKWYETVQNCPVWEPKWFQLFARLAKDSPGAFDFSPHYGLIFSRLIRSFGFHLGSGLGSGRVLVGSGGKHWDWDSLTMWLAYQLGGPGRKAEEHLRGLFATLESYLHPSNTGKHTERLLNFLYRLSRQLCIRLHRERYKSPDWTPSVPAQLRLTDEDVERFVRMALPAALTGMFSKVRQDLSTAAIRHLALLAPKLVIPAVLEKLYGALETLTEPHRLLNSLSALNACLIPLVRDGTPWDKAQRAKFASPGPSETSAKAGKKKRQSKGELAQEAPSLRLHAVPLLNALLPALDPNDISKAMLAFQAVSLLVALVPLVDCSEGVEEVEGLTAEERELASATATLEAWTNLLLDRLFALLLNTAQGHSRPLRADQANSASANSAAHLSIEESYIKLGLCGIFRALVSNSSTPIYRTVAMRLKELIQWSLFDSFVTCETLTEMLYSAVRVDPEFGLREFLPLVLGELRGLVTEELKAEEEVDVSVLWWLSLARGCVRTDGAALLAHKDEVEELLALSHGFRCKQAYGIAHSVLEYLLGSLSSQYLLNYQARRLLLDSPVTKHFAVRHWGQPTKRKNFSVKWHVPSVAERDFAQKLLESRLRPSLDLLAEPAKLSPEEILRELSLIGVCLTGAGTLVPQLEGPLVNLVSAYLVPPSPFSYATRPAEVEALSFRGGHVRNQVLQALRSLLAFLLKEREDDTKSMIAVAKIYHVLVFHLGLYKTKYDRSVKSFNYSKKAVGDIVRGKKAVLESTFTEFALIAHHKRLLEQRSAYYFTGLHVEVMEDLFRLSTSHYSVVRREGQAVLQMITNMYPYAYREILPRLLHCLKDSPDVSHEELKGALYVLGGGKAKALVVRQSWATLAQLWPALIQAQHSEKPSIIACFDDLQNTVVDNLESFQIQLEVSEELVEVGRAYWKAAEGLTLPSWPRPTAEEELKASQAQARRSADNQALYSSIITGLNDLSNDSALHWRHADMAQSLLSLMIRRDQVFPEPALQTMTKLLVHDTLKTRKMVMSFFTAWLKILKPRPVKVPYCWPEGVKPLLSTDAGAGSSWGYRSDNACLLWRDSEVPRSEEAWNKTQFVEQTHWGFSCWPADFATYAAPPEQAPWSRAREELSAEERPLFDALQNPAYVARLVEYLSIEEKKGEDAFQSTNYAFFKGIFRLYGGGVVGQLRPVVGRLLGSEKEGEQRLGAEIVAGIVQGSKLWPYSALEELWGWLSPLLEATWAKLTSESNRNWGTCVATALNSRDPRRLRWMIEAARRVAQREEDSSFHLSNRLYVFQGALNQLEWRVPELWREMLGMSLPMASSAYQNVRSRLGSCFSTITWFDLPGIRQEAGRDVDRLVQLDEVLEALFDRLPVLRKEILSAEAAKATNGLLVPEEDPARKEELLVWKTLLSFLNAHWPHGYVSVSPGLLRLLPLLCYFENESGDEELKRDALYQRLYLAKAELFGSLVKPALEELEAMTRRPWWKSKISALRYLQLAAFSNLFLWAEERSRVVGLVEGLLGEARLEVREAAGQTLSGLIHCGFAPVDAATGERFAAMARRGGVEGHAGVLGLAALVSAYPYQVPSFLPAALMALSTHSTSGDAAVRASVRKCLAEFKRTHLDSWQEHKERFSEDQLNVLTDLLVSPSYYV